ncbi:MAG: putative Ig domain-containing protein, partial [Bacteroidota bacterium]
TWTNPKNLGNKINTATNECGAEITDDSLYLTYVSNNDIYWVGSGFIDSLRYTNFVPYVFHLIPNQTVLKGESFTYTIPDTTFIDDDGNNTLTYGAKLTNGNPLPTWLSFDSITATFSGIPPIIETLNIKVTATDTAGASAFTNLKIIVNNPVSIDQINGQNDAIKIFPNPTSGLINISFNSLSGETAIAEVYNLQGEVIRTNTFRQSFRMDMTNNPKGIYILKLLFDDEIIVRKICIQ